MLDMEILDVPFDDEELAEMRWVLAGCAMCGADVRVDPRDHKEVRHGRIELRCPDCGEGRSGRTVGVGSLEELAHLADRDEDAGRFRGRRELGGWSQDDTSSDSSEEWMEDLEEEDWGEIGNGEIFDVLDEDEEW